MIDPKHILGGNPISRWKKYVFPALERASQLIVGSWVFIIAVVSIFLAYFVLRVLFVMLRLAESALGGVQ